MFWWKITGGKRGEVCMGNTLHWMVKGAASHSNGIRVNPRVSNPGSATARRL